MGSAQVSTLNLHDHYAVLKITLSYHHSAMNTTIMAFGTGTKHTDYLEPAKGEEAYLHGKPSTNASRVSKVCHL